MSAAGAATPRASRYGVLLIVLVAVAAMAPELALGLTVSDSFRYNLLWPEQFAGLFRQGQLYPRWLPLAWGGLGNPTFYFYPPLFFWVAAVIDTITGGSLTPARFTPLATLVVLAASGLTMRAWLIHHVDNRRALAGAIAYIVAPYHLYDIYARGALAEATTYALVPLVALALKRLGEGRSNYVPVLGAAYGALLLTHLPSALLVSLFLIAPCVAVLAAGSDRTVRFLAQALAGGVLGIGLAAFYLLPALGLLPYVSADALSASFYRPENWFFWHVNAGPMGGRMMLIVPIGIGALCLGAGAAVWARGREARFWAALAVVLVILIAGAIPPVWKLPGLEVVQFPWRALVLVEFAVVTALAITAPPLRKPLMLAGAATLAIAYAVLGMLIAHVIERTWTTQERAAAEIRRDYSDAPEYLPAGTKIVQGSGPAPEHIELPSLRTVHASDARARLSVTEADDGSMVVLIDSPQATAVVLPRFYFPHWQLRDSAGRPVAIKATARGRLVAFEAPAGRSTFRLSLGRAPYEGAGELIGLATLVLLASATFITMRGRRSAGAGRMHGDQIA
jgi:6-pyruvoyl-tetrahydropterin synthase-like protein